MFSVTNIHKIVQTILCTMKAELEKKCTKAPTYLEKIRTDEVLKSLEAELKEIKK